LNGREEEKEKKSVLSRLCLKKVWDCGGKGMEWNQQSKHVAAFNAHEVGFQFQDRAILWQIKVE